MGKIQLGVFFGSRSCEREVSIISAVQLMQHADPDKYDVHPIYITEQGRWYTGEPLKQMATYQHFDPNKKGIERCWLDLASGSGALMTLRPAKGLFSHAEEAMLCRLDVCILAFHGLHGEDGTVQGLLELANIPYSSTGVAGSAIGMDKIMMKQFFRGANLPVLPGQGYTRAAWQKDADAVEQEVEQRFGFPVFVKPANLGSSIGVTRANNQTELHESFALAFDYDRRVLVEQGLDHPVELNCSVLGYDDEVQASPIEMPVVGDGEAMLDFMGKYLRGQKSAGMANLDRLLPAPIPDELRDRLQQMSMDIFRMLDCKGVVRIDYMQDRATQDIYITEINTIPGSLSFYLWQAAGLRYRQLIDKLVDYARRAHADKNDRSYSFTSDILSAVSLGGAKGSKGSKGGMVQ